MFMSPGQCHKNINLFNVISQDKDSLLFKELKGKYSPDGPP